MSRESATCDVRSTEQLNDQKFMTKEELELVVRAENDHSAKLDPEEREFVLAAYPEELEQFTAISRAEGRTAICKSELVIVAGRIPE